MMKITGSVLLSLAFALLAQIGSAQDRKGCQDSPLVTRFPGSVLINCIDKADNTYEFRNGPATQTVEGEFHFREYRAPETATTAQLERNYITALRNAGYAIVFEAQGHDSFVGHMGKTWIRIYIRSDAGMEETIVTETALKQEVVATAAALTSGLGATGHTVVNGIYFDTGKADVKPESSAALDEVVKALKQDPKLKVFVVGHTDNVGAVAANLDLSKRRAAAVVQVLTTKYSVAADRLQSYGVGPYAPISSNDSEAGRTLNRRVELVKQ
jgi:outer membrane protein OmpA-like peptidoglycan-associated protein